MSNEQSRYSKIKAEIIGADFSPVEEKGFSPGDYDQGAVCAKLQNHFPPKELLRIVDQYTSGNNGVIVSSGPSCDSSKEEQWLVMSPEIVTQLKANLRTNTPVKTFAQGAGHQR